MKQLYRSLYNKLYGNAILLKHLPFQMQIPYLSRKTIALIRDARLRDTARYAAKNVPYYRNLFKTLKINPQDIRSTHDLDALPITERRSVSADPRQFVSESQPQNHLVHIMTSGSSGQPTSIYHDKDSMLANIAFGFREKAPVRQLLGKVHKELFIFYHYGAVFKVLDFYSKNTFSPRPTRREFLSITDPLEKIIDAINRFQPDIIASFGSYLEYLFTMIDAYNIPIHVPKAVYYGSDMLTDEGKRFIQSKWGIPIFSTYQTVEAFKIGFFCERLNGFHIHEDLCDVKIVDDNGRRVQNGVTGQVVISNLVNRGTVLLNYRLGDLAVLSDEPCPCGRSFIRLIELRGRLDDNIFLSDSVTLHPRMIWGAIKKLPHVLQYQFIQHELNRFELKLVVSTNAMNEQIADKARLILHEIVGRSAVIDVAYHETLERPKGGKFSAVLSYYKPKALK
jgi:phenylacetate-CoA ligase